MLWTFAHCSCASLCVYSSLSIIGVFEETVWYSMGPVLGSLLIEHPEALLLPSKPSMRPQESLTFPAFQTVQPRVHASPIQYTPLLANVRATT